MNRSLSFAVVPNEHKICFGMSAVKELVLARSRKSPRRAKMVRLSVEDFAGGRFNQ